jgi:membrane protein
MKDFLYYWFNVVLAASKNWSESRAFVYAAALAFFTVFSIAPMVIVAVSIVALLLGEQAAEGKVMEHLQDTIGPTAADFVQSAVISSQMEEGGLFPTMMGIGAIALGATTVFAQMQRSLNDIWDVAPKPSSSSMLYFIKSRLLSLTLVLSIGFILLVSLFLGVMLRTIIVFSENWLPMHHTLILFFEIALSLGMVSVLFAAIFRILPDVVLSWKDVMIGAIVTALLFTLGRSFISMYLANTATASTYGAAGSLVVLLLWVNYSSLILLCGAAFTRAQLEAKGGIIYPRKSAVRVTRRFIEE